MDPPKINKIWKLWYHSIKDNDWSKKSYEYIYSIKNIYDYNTIIEVFKQNHYQNGMFFFMKDNVFPNWEDPNNRLGGCLSFKVSSSKVIEEWNITLLRCIMGTLFQTKNDHINGLSISPKKEFNIIKVWFSKNIDYKEDYLEPPIPSEMVISNSIYKKHSI